MINNAAFVIVNEVVEETDPLSTAVPMANT